MESHDPLVPRARDEGLVVQELPDELLVYDLDRHRSHCLNRTAALVWRHCDGITTVRQMVALLREESDAPSDEAAVWLALDRLQRAHLLKEPITVPDLGSFSTRRALVRKMALVGGLALVTSIAVPEAAQAAQSEISPSECTNLLPENIGKCCNNHKICHLSSSGAGCDGGPC